MYCVLLRKRYIHFDACWRLFFLLFFFSLREFPLFLLLRNNNQALKRDKRSDQAQGRRTSGCTSIIWGYLSEEQRYLSVGLEKEGAGAAASSLALGFGRGWSELLLGGGIRCRRQSPTRSCFFCCGVSLYSWEQPLNWGLINTLPH